MRRRALHAAAWVLLPVAAGALCEAQTAGGMTGGATTPPPTAQTAVPAAPAGTTPVQGGVVQGRILAGAVPLPGVAITATNALTGARYATATAADGSYRLHIPADGHYVLKADMPAFAADTFELRFGGATGGARQQNHDFAMTLASRVPAAAEDRGALGPSTGGRLGQRSYDGYRGGSYGGGGGGRRGGGGADSSQLLSLLGESGAVDAGEQTASGPALPSLGGSSDFQSDSVAVQGQSNNAGNEFAGIDFNALRERAENDPSLGGGGFGGGNGGGNGGGGGGRGGGGGGFGGGGGGFGGFGGGGGGGFRGSFRKFNPNQPHGGFFWTGDNSALNALDYALRGQSIAQPSYAGNQFGLTVASTPNIPHLIEHDRNDFVFFTLSGQRSSTPFDNYATVPSAAERAGNFSGLTGTDGTVTPIYDPFTGLPFPNNTIPSARITSQAAALLQYYPLPNLPGTSRNYEDLTSEENNTTLIGLRFIHSFGGGSNGSPLAGLIRQYMGNSQGVQQNVHVNYNYDHAASDNLDVLPALGGKTQTHSRSLELGYTISKGRLTNNLTLDWNRVSTDISNYFTNVNNVAGQIGLNIFGNTPTNPLNYGLPNITLNQFTGFTEQQPSFTTNQTLALAESSSWTHRKNNFRWGADIKRVQLNALGNAAIDATGTYLFTGLFTENPTTIVSTLTGTSTQSGVASSGSSLADLLLGFPQETTLQAPYAKSYLRENVYDAYFQDDWRALPSLTVLAGLRYEYFSPYSETQNRLATLDPTNDFADVTTVTPHSIGPDGAKYARGLVNPEKNDFSPRIGFAWRVARDTVVRGGYGINYANGQYNKFVQQFAFQAPFADVQTNEVTSGALIDLANGFPSPQSTGDYSVDRNYRLPYVQVWNLGVQRTLPGQIVLNVGYSGSKGTRLDIVDAPGRTTLTSQSGTYYDYEQSTAFSNYNGLAVSLRRRLHSGLSLQATYTYSHSIDDATSVGGVGDAVAQNWQDLLAEESNSSFDIRHKVSGNFVYELPFGGDRTWLTSGPMAKVLEGLSVSGTYSIATGEPLTPSYVATVTDVARGSAGSERPDRVAGVSLTKGAGNVNEWFNTAAFATPAGTYGNASRYSIPGPGTISVDGSLSKTVSLGSTRSFEVRATANNVFNTVQYSSVSTQLGSAEFGEVTGTAAMRQFTFLARFRF